jgi:tripartite-type tricarboxylate transporter receptor subunit TctC
MPRTLAAGLAISFLALSGSASAQNGTYPNHPIRVIVPYGPGGADVQLRVVGPILTRLLGQPFVIENREGAGGVIGTAMVKSAPADGYTLLFTATAALTMVPHLPAGANYKASDFVPIGNMTGNPLILVARADEPYKNFDEFIAYARAHPGKVNLGSAGIGTNTHILGVGIASTAGVRFTHIPFRGVAQAVQGMLGGNADFVIGLAGVMLPFVQNGKLRPLASTGATRSEWFPNVPTLKEKGLDVVESNRVGIFAPKGTPTAIVNKLAGALAEAVKQPEFRDTMKKSTTTVLYQTPEALAKQLVMDSAYWERMLGDPKFAAAMKQ